MSEEDEPSVLGALPHSRSHRRSDKRAPRPAATKPDPQVPGAEPAEPSAEPPLPPTGDEEAAGAEGTGATELLTTAVQAAAELAEIGLTAGARALRIALSRLPRP